VGTARDRSQRAGDASAALTTPATTPASSASILASTPGSLASRGKEALAGIVTIIALVGFAAFIVYLLIKVSADEKSWSRRVYLFAAVEAVAFAAVGWLFGREVHRERAESAEQRADNAEQKADVATTDATTKTMEAAQYRDRGLILKRQIKRAHEQHQPPPHLRQDLAGSTFVTQTQSKLESLAEQAEDLFPE
jgi:hypothetical protein